MAETLITLGIIGVVAAMTLSTVINNMQNNQLEVQLKKAYSELSQLAIMFMAEYSISVPAYCSKSNTSHVKFIKEIFPKYIKGGHKVSSWTYADIDEDGSNTTTMPYSLFAMSGNTAVKAICDNYGVTSAVNGVMYYFDDPPTISHGTVNTNVVVCADINGKKKPNRYGKDFFLFLFTTDGFVIPMGQTHKDNAKACTSTSGSCNNFANVGNQYCQMTNQFLYNTSCAYYALQNKHPSKSGKDYWHDFINGK